MNHESGNLVWMAPDAIGEILHAVPALADEFVFPLASFREIEPFGPGVYRGLARIAEGRPAALRPLLGLVTPCLEHGDAVIRAHAALVIDRVDPTCLAGARPALERDEAPLRIYDFGDGIMRDVRVCDLVASA